MKKLVIIGIATLALSACVTSNTENSLFQAKIQSGNDFKEVEAVQLPDIDKDVIASEFYQYVGIRGGRALLKIHPRTGKVVELQCLGPDGNYHIC